jgi:HK97 family phage portal protein
MNNPFKALGNIITKASYSLSGIKLFFGNQAFVQNRDYLDSYDVNWLVHTCVDKIAEAVSSTKFKLYKVSKSEDIDEVKSHRILDLLEKPNKFISRFEMLEAIATFLKLLGNAYILKVRGESTRQVQELWLLRPDWVKIYYDPIKIINYYEYDCQGVRTIYQPEDIIHIKQFNPKDPFYGLSTVKPMIETIKTLIFSTRYNMNFFYNSARPDALIISKVKLKADEASEFERKWHAKFGGWEQSNKVGFINGDATYQQVNQNAKDMQFAQLTEITQNQILSAFGVPKPVVAMTDNLNRATADAAIYAFMKFGVQPDIQRIVDKLNEGLVPEFATDIYLDYENPVPIDRLALVNEYAFGYNKWLTTNEIRDKEGLLPVEGGWSIYTNFGVVPLEEASITGENPTGTEGKHFIEYKINPKDYYKQKKEKEQEMLKGRILPRMINRKEQRVKKEMREVLLKYVSNLKEKRKAFTVEQKQEIFNEHTKTIKSDLGIFRVMVRQLFANQKKRVMDAITNDLKARGKSLTKASADLTIDIDIENGIFASIAKPVFADIIIRRAKRASKLLGEVYTQTERTLKFIDKKTNLFADEINKTTFSRIKVAVKEGVSAGESIDSIAERIDNVYKQRGGVDSVTIARTEVISSSNEATLESYLQSDVVEEKEWLATMDDRVRESHAEMNGERAIKDERFSNGMMYPGDMVGNEDEVINCRCDILPYFEGMEKSKVVNNK